MSRLTAAIFAAALIITSHFAVNAQATTGVLKGTVVDSAGSVVAGAKVTAKNEGTGIESTMTTNAEGIFNFAALSPGSYTVSIEAANFKRSLQSGVKVNVGIVNPITVNLEVGSVSEAVTVTSNTDDTLQSEQSQISATIDARRVQDLPSNTAGGGIDTLALLIPGVSVNNLSGTNTNGTGFSVNGNRGRSNNFQIDGSDNNDLSVAGPALFVDFQDSVQEVQVITNNFDARYGRNQGAIVNIVGKTGSNDFHGSAFLHHRDAQALDSLNNIFRRNGQTENDPFLYNVFGGSIGGPVYLPKFGSGGPGFWSGRDKAFFYFAYQGIRNPSSTTGFSTSLGILPSEFGRLQSTFPGNAVADTIAKFSPWAIPGAQLNTNSAGTPANALINTNPATGCPRAIAAGTTPPAGCGGYVSLINPATGQPFQIGGPFDVVNLGSASNPLLFQAAQYQRTVPTDFTENYWNLRFDVKPTNRDNVTFRLLKQNSVAKNAAQANAALAGGFNGDIPAGSTNYGGYWTRSFTSSTLNDLRVTYQKIGVDFGGGCDVATPGCIPSPDQIGNSFTNIAFPTALGLTKTNSLPTIGQSTALPQGRTGKVYQVADNFTWNLGKHALTFGAEFKYLKTLTPFLPNFNGSYSFNSATRIANNAPTAVSITLGDPLLEFPERDQYYFVQDDFKVKPNLTLNLGLRYEYTGQPINELNKQTTARESDKSTALFDTNLPLDQRTVPRVAADKNNFAPRVGFAYTPHFWKKLFGEDATVFRGGYSIAYDAAFYNILTNVMNTAPFSVSLAIPPASLPNIGSPAPLPTGPFGNVVRDAAAASGLLPTGVLNPVFLAQTQVADNYKSPYSEQWSFGVQRLIGKKHIVEARYVGNHGIGLFQSENGNFFDGPLVNGFSLGGFDFPSFANLLPPGTVAQNCVDNPATPDIESSCNGRQFRAGGRTVRTNSASSIYHSLQARYGGRFLNDSLSVNASYTWSKTMDNASEIFANAATASPNAQNPFCVNKCEWSLSEIDRPQTFSTNFVFDVPFFKQQKGLVGHLLGGWQFNGTYIISSGQVFTPNNGVAGLLGLGNTYLTAGDRPFNGNSNVDPRLVGISQIDANLLFGIDVVNPNGFWLMNGLNEDTTRTQAVTPSDVRYIINGPGAAKIFGTPFGDVARNTERGPIFNNFNLSVFKNIRVMESVKVQLRAEAFNVLNHPNPGFGTNGGNGLPVTNLTGAGAAGSAYDEFQDIQYANRIVQVGLRIVF